MYNSIYPININYSKPKLRNNPQSGTPAQNSQISYEENNKNNNQNTFPNGAKVAIDYTKGQINISQVLTDFRSTILAINAPKEVQDEVSVYLGLVEKESLKEKPSREIIVSNLKNASKISDNYIANALNKPSNVVEKWIETLFLQKINLKSDPNEINPAFQLEFPAQAQERIDKAKEEQTKEVPIDEEIISQESEFIEEVQDEKNEEIKFENTPEETGTVVVDSSFEVISNSEVNDEDNVSIAYEKPIKTPFAPLNETDKKARELFVQAKKMPQNNKGDIDAINLLNEALGVIQNKSEANENIRAAIHLERGKIFDNYDYVDYALRDYYEATKANDLNLKAQAFYKSGQIYDEFSEFSPALDNYLSSVAYSGEADNIPAQTHVLSKIASMYTRQYDIQNTDNFTDLALSTAQSTNNQELIAKTYSTSAQNYQYLGQNEKALDNYKNALHTFSRADESYEQMAYNYEQAAIVMEKLGNKAKAAKLQLKANQCYQKAQLQQSQLEEAS